MRISALAAGAVLVLAAACGGSGATNPPGPTPPPAATATLASGCSGSGAGTAVQIADFAFNPASVTVSVGSEVTWTNVDSAMHTVTFDNGPDCGRLGNGAKASNTFAAAGTFAYHCAIHSSMRGTVIVQ